MNPKRIYILFFTLLCINFAIYAQASTNNSEALYKEKFEKAMLLFSKNNFAEAKPIFEQLMYLPEAGKYQVESAYGDILILFKENDEEALQSLLDYFIENFQDSDHIANVNYLNARLSFLKKDYEKAILLYEVFLNNNDGDTSSYATDAKFDFAEAMYELGKFDSAQKIYEALLSENPSQYITLIKCRLGLIQFSQREEKLLTLLKWSHEEALKVTEELQSEKIKTDSLEKQYNIKLEDIKSSNSLDSQNNEINKKQEELAKKEKELNDLAIKLEMKQKALSLIESLLK